MRGRSRPNGTCASQAEARRLDRVRHRYAGGDDATPVSRRAESGLAIILERLCCPRDARFRFYDPAAEPNQFAQDFLREARARCGIATRSHAQDQRIIDQALGHWLAAEALPSADVALCRLTRLSRIAASSQSASRKARSAPGCSTMAGPCRNRGRRWSISDVANLRRPMPKDRRRWTVTFQCVAMRLRNIGKPSCRCGSAYGRRTMAFDAERHRRKTASVPSSGDAVVRFRCPTRSRRRRWTRRGSASAGPRTGKRNNSFCVTDSPLCARVRRSRPPSGNTARPDPSA